MKMNQKGNDCFETPDEIYDQLDRIFNFTLDAACTLSNCKCEKGFYFDNGFDGLKESWGGERVFCNPPFSKKADWIRKAHKAVQSEGCPIVAMLLPSNCMDSEAFQNYIYPNYNFEILRGRVSFIDPETKKPKAGNNSGTVIVYFRKHITRGKEKDDIF